MNKLVILFVILFSNITLAQNGLKFERTNAVQAFDQSSFFLTLEKNFDGSIYLFKEWSNSASVFMKDGGNLILDNVNFNIKDDVFQVKVSSDSILTFGIENLKRLVIKNRIFKKIYANNQNKTYEEIYSSKDLSILKSYEVEVIPASNDPMAARSKNKFSQRSKYFIKRASGFLDFKLNKKGVLSLVDDNVIKDVQKFVKNNKLSYKKDDDLKRILKYAFNK